MAAPKTLQALPGLDPAILKILSAADQQKLLDAINGARRAQDDEYRNAFDDALSHVPFLLRGAVRKIIAG